MKDTAAIMGVQFTTKNLSETVDTIASRLKQEKKTELYHIVTANPEIVMASRDDKQLQDILRNAGIVTPDGIGIVLASRWLGKPLRERVTGFDVLLGLLDRGNREGFSMFLLGADEATNAAAAEVIGERYPGVKIAGRHHGYFKKEDEPAILAEIEKARADLLVVALGAPRAERWIYGYRGKLPVKAAIGVGGSLDVIAGKVKRAPVVWQKLNVEWLYRLLSEPSRWRRQLVLPKFAWRALWSRGKH